MTQMVQEEIQKLKELNPHLTVYLKNMKKKLNCRTKFELIALVVESDFLKNIDF